jgi:hypothetical protein
MQATVFDLIEQEGTQGQGGETAQNIFDLIDSKQEPSAIKEGLQFGAKGFAGGLGTPGSLLEMAGLQTTEQLPGEKIRQQREAESFSQRPSFYEMMGESDILPERIVIPTQEQTTAAAEALGAPSGKPETRTGRFAERIGEAVGSAASLGGAGTLPLAGAAALGQATEEVTGSPTAGTVVELGSALLSPALAKKVAVGKKNKDLVNVGRKLGLSENQLTPLVQNEKKLKVLSKFARKGDKTEKLITGIEATLGDGYGTIKNRAKGLAEISPEVKSAMSSDFEKVLAGLKKTIQPSPEKEQAIKYLSGAVENMKIGVVDPESLINFYQDLNQFVNWRSIKNGKKQLSQLKKPILGALKTADPELAKDFEVLNKLYGRFKDVQKNLSPDKVDRWLNKGEVGALVLSLGTGYPGISSLLLKETVGRRAIRELLINPRFQGIQRKLLSSIKKDNTKAAAAVGKELVRFVKDKFPDDVNDDLDENIFNRL